MPCRAPTMRGLDGRSGSACYSRDTASCVRSPTRVRWPRYSERRFPSPRLAADSASSARSATSGATPRQPTWEKSYGPCSRHDARHRGPRNRVVRTMPSGREIASELAGQLKSGGSAHSLAGMAQRSGCLNAAKAGAAHRAGSHVPSSGPGLQQSAAAGKVGLARRPKI
jgi:hypothetical protein